MIQELSNLIESLGEMKDFGLRPRLGLHLLLEKSPEGGFALKHHEVYSKKDKTVSEFLQECARRDQSSWCINTDKCLDLPAKGIQSASPFCLGFKKDSLPGGEKYDKDRTKILDRIGPYFDKAIYLIEGEEDKQTALAFKHFCQNNLMQLLQQVPAFAELKEAEYVVLYLDLPLEKYRQPHRKYLKERLFNTAEYNVTDEAGETHGTSNFFNGYNSKKPFLIHQTAPFDINGRISGKVAQRLHEFEQLAGRGVLPNPIPIFIDKDELNREVVSLFNQDSSRIGYREIVEDLLKRKEDLQNYYLLFYRGGEIKDFDFVSKFVYELKDDRTEDPFWIIYNLFHLREKKVDLRPTRLDHVFDFQNEVVRLIFNNTMVQRGKDERLSYRYFDELDPKYYSADTFLLFMKYRKAVYDYVYKSRRQAIPALVFKDIMLTSILDAVRQDKEYAAKEKLNIYFSLNHHFDPENQNLNGYYMPDTLDRLLEKTMLIADSKERVAVDSPEEFSFISGQVIDYLLDQSQSADTSHALLEPFLQKTQLTPFKEEIIRTFNRYKHEVARKGGRRVKNLMREICGYDQPINIREYMSFILAGYFSPSFIYKKKEETINAENE
jgi:CRISPR-associated protein Csh1